MHTKVNNKVSNEVCSITYQRASHLPVPCRHLSSELSEHEKLIDKMVSADFTKYITEDLNRPLDDSRPLLEEVGGYL